MIVSCQCSSAPSESRAARQPAAFPVAQAAESWRTVASRAAARAKKASARAVAAAGPVQQLLDMLGHGSVHPFASWPLPGIPALPGLYTV